MCDSITYKEGGRGRGRERRKEEKKYREGGRKEGRSKSKREQRNGWWRVYFTGTVVYRYLARYMR